MPISRRGARSTSTTQSTTSRPVQRKRRPPRNRHGNFDHSTDADSDCQDTVNTDQHAYGDGHTDCFADGDGDTHPDADRAANRHSPPRLPGLTRPHWGCRDGASPSWPAQTARSTRSADRRVNPGMEACLSMSSRCITLRPVHGRPGPPAHPPLKSRGCGHQGWENRAEGAADGPATVVVYDPALDLWTTRPSTAPTRHYAFTATSRETMGRSTSSGRTPRRTVMIRRLTPGRLCRV